MRFAALAFLLVILASVAFGIYAKAYVKANREWTRRDLGKACIEKGMQYHETPFTHRPVCKPWRH